MAKKPFLGIPGGDVRVETPDGTTRTFGNVNRQSLDDASWIGEPGFGERYSSGGAFPDEEPFGESLGNFRAPTMRKPVNE